MSTWINFYNRLETFESFFHKKILMPLAFTAVFLAALSMLFQVFFRLVLIHYVNFSFPYTDELTRYLLIATTYLMAPVVIKEGSAPGLDLLQNVLRGKVKYVLYFIIKAIIIFCLIVLFHYLAIVIKINTRYTSPIIGVPGWLLYSIPLVGLITMSFQTFVELLGIITKGKKPFEYEREEEGIDLNEEELE